MTYETLTALIGFAFAMSISPGPGNFLLLASGANFGIVRTVPLILGISGGFLSMVFVVGLGLGPVLRDNETLYLILRLACVAYVLWLALKIATMKTVTTGDVAAASKPIGFFHAAAFQLVNPKAWVVALIVTVSYTKQEAYLASLIMMITVFAVVNVPTISCWAFFGTGLRRLLGTERKMRVFNIVMAALLVGSMVPVILGSTTN